MVWTFGFIAGLYAACVLHGLRFFVLYALAAILWALFHFAYIAWYFYRGKDLAAVSNLLELELQQPLAGGKG